MRVWAIGAMAALLTALAGCDRKPAETPAETPAPAPLSLIHI